MSSALPPASPANSAGCRRRLRPWTAHGPWPRTSRQQRTHQPRRRSRRSWMFGSCPPPRSWARSGGRHLGYRKNCIDCRLLSSVIAFAAALIAAAWPPVRGVVDVQVRNPNLGDPGCVVLQDATVRCWPSALFVGQWQAENWPRPQLVARRELAGVREFGGPDCVLLRKGQVRCLRDGTFQDAGITGAVQVVSDGEAACARLKDGGVSCWGSNPESPPARVHGLPPLKSLALGAGVCGLTEEG